MSQTVRQWFRLQIRFWLRSANFTMRGMKVRGKPRASILSDHIKISSTRVVMKSIFESNQISISHARSPLLSLPEHDAGNYKLHLKKAPRNVYRLDLGKPFLHFTNYGDSKIGASLNLHVYPDCVVDFCGSIKRGEPYTRLYLKRFEDKRLRAAFLAVSADIRLRSRMPSVVLYIPIGIDERRLVKTPLLLERK